MLATNSTEKMNSDHELYRIGVPGDGSCFFHAILACLDAQYQRSNLFEKSIAVKQFRILLASRLTLQSFSTMETNGTFLHNDLPSDISAYIQAPLVFKDATVLQRFQAFQAYISNPVQFVGEELYLLLSEVIDYDIYLLGNYFYQDPLKAFKGRNAIILLNVGGFHWEAVGALSDGKLQTIHSPSSALISTLHSYNKSCWEIVT